MSRLSTLRRARLLAAAGAVAIVGVGTLSLTADAAPSQERQDEINREVGDVYHAADLRRQSRWTGEGEVWPPRPNGAGAPTRLEQRDAPQYGNDPLAQRIAANAEVAELLGDRWSVLEVADNAGDAKDNRAQGRSTITYFSRSTNRSVIVDVAGQRVHSVETMPATVNQLPVTPEEANEAIEIARQHWQEQGKSRVNDLEGFVIMALQPGGALFDVRMVYVSFHVDADAHPEFVTWVDLTNEVVSHGREEN